LPQYEHATTELEVLLQAVHIHNTGLKDFIIEKKPHVSKEWAAMEAQLAGVKRKSKEIDAV
jgi:hypothetical protein